MKMTCGITRLASIKFTIIIFVGEKKFSGRVAERTRPKSLDDEGA
jgi:hypothetical protein